MATTNPASTSADLNVVPHGETGLDLLIEREIRRRVGGRIQDLRVVCTDDLIILEGTSRTYHAKQLAQEALLDLTEGRTLLSNQINVY